MTTRLSDILDRLRPTGTPGAPSEGSGQREEDNRLDETSAVVACLVGFEKEAGSIVEEARRRADQIRGQAQSRVRQIDAELPDRVATAGVLQLVVQLRRRLRSRRGSSHHRPPRWNASNTMSTPRSPS